MRGAAVISALLHLVLVALAYFGLPELFNAREPVEVPITVEVVTIAEEATAPPQPVVETPPAPKPEPPPEPVAKEPESVAEPVAEPPPEPEPAPVPAPQEALEPAPAPEAAPPPEPAQELAAVDPVPPPVEKKPAPEAPAAATSPPPRPLNKPRREIKPAFDPTRIAALLDKTKRDETPPPPAETPEPAPQAEAKPTPRLATLSARLAMTELDALRAQIERCWSVPAGAREAQDMAVVVRIYLKPDGRLSRDPQVLQSARMSDPFFRTMAESALRAVRKCEPLRVLSGNYEMWREIDLTFNPKDMLGG